jgi:hypothetical protein
VPKPLAEIVIEEGLATAAEVARAAEWADHERVPLVAALVHHLGLDDVALVAALRRHVRIGLGDPGTTAPDLDAIRELPREVARRLRVVPLEISPGGGGRRGLALAVADPTDAVALAEVEHVTGCEIEPTLLPLAAVEELVETSYRHLVTAVMRREARPRRETGGGRDALADSPAGTPPAAAADGSSPAPTDPARPGSGSPPDRDRLPDRDLAARHDALLRVLVRKQVVTLDEYEAELGQTGQGRDPEG